MGTDFASQGECGESAFGIDVEVDEGLRDRAKFVGELDIRFVHVVGHGFLAAHDCMGWDSCVIWGSTALTLSISLGPG